MNPKVINPYTKLGNKHRESLDYIIANLPPNPTFDDLNDQLTDSFYTPDPNDPNPVDALVQVIQTMLPNAYNGYVNGRALQSMRHSERSEESPNNLSGGILRSQSLPQNDGGGYWRYNESQMSIISQMLNGINTVPPESIWEYLVNIEEDIVSGKLTYEEQAPLLIATAIGKPDHEYWMEQMNTPGSWATYLNSDLAINYAHLSGIVSACLQGSLLTYGLIKPPQIQLLDAFTSVISSTGMAAGKVMFGWIPVR